MECEVEALEINPRGCTSPLFMEEANSVGSIKNTHNGFQRWNVHICSVLLDWCSCVYLCGVFVCVVKYVFLNLHFSVSHWFEFSKPRQWNVFRMKWLINREGAYYRQVFTIIEIKELLLYPWCQEMIFSERFWIKHSQTTNKIWQEQFVCKS